MARRARIIPKSSTKKLDLTRRDCLRCDREFLSEGPYNRLCKSCLEYLGTSPTPVEEYTIGYP
jgi:5-methylcytosine-specific restriction endonuclease McrBC regulatory subunit McrC